MEEILCIDIGGSKYMVGVVTPEGKILQCRKFLWKDEKGNPGKIMGRIIETVDKAFENHPRCIENPVGITIPGLVDAEEGVWRSSEFLGISNLPVGAVFKRRYGVSLAMENDANACAYAECFFGEGRVCKNFLYLTVSNSIGGALCLNGEIYTGAWGDAGEFGMCLVEDMLEEESIRRPLETLASGRGLSDNYCRMKGIAGGRQIHAAVLERYAQKGDEAAARAFELEGIYLGRAIAHAAFLLNPQKVVLGGGLSLLFDSYQSTLMDTLRREMKQLPNSMPEVKATSLGYHGALLGAAALVLKHQGVKEGSENG